MYEITRLPVKQFLLLQNMTAFERNRSAFKYLLGIGMVNTFWCLQLAGCFVNVIVKWNEISKWLLQGYFARNPRERDLLEKDKKLQALNLKSPAIADVPDYIGQSAVVMEN